MTLSEVLVAELGDLAERLGIPVSQVVARAVAREVRLAAGRRALEAWQQEHGRLTPDELAQARAEAAAADAELIAALGNGRESA